MPYTYTDRLSTAFAFAHAAHSGQVRKGSNVPYICHPMGVAALVIEAGGSEDAVIAALLHDTVEDTSTSIEDVERKFGGQVAYLVKQLTQDKIDWKSIPKEDRQRVLRESRIANLEKLRVSHYDVRLVKQADTLYNVQSIVDQYHQQGEYAFRSFRGGADEVILKYTEMANNFWVGGPDANMAYRLVDAMKKLAELRVYRALTERH